MRSRELHLITVLWQYSRALSTKALWGLGSVSRVIVAISTRQYKGMVTPATLYLSHPGSAESPVLDKRQKHRIATDTPAMLRLLQPFVPGYLHVRILDVSKDGLRVASSVPLEPGATVHIRLAKSAVIAEVRHCTAGPDGFQAGLQLDSVTPL
jgi:hypothetical protein